MPRRRKRKSFVDLVREIGSVGRLRDLSRRRIAAQKRRELAPTDPAAAIAQMKKLGARFAKLADKLLVQHVLPSIGNGQALEAAIAVFGRELDAAASQVRDSALPAGKKAVKHAKKEYERIARTILPKETPAHAEQFASIVELAYQKIANDQAAMLIKWARKPGVTAQDLRYALWVTRNRTQTVARTETNRWFEFAFRAWNEAAGEEYFIWVTRRDELVRHKHRLLDGKTFAWATGAGPDGILPGQEINCRCKAIPASAELV